jgi:hypothetical protein
LGDAVEKVGFFQNTVGWGGKSASPARFYVKSQPELALRTFKISTSDAYFDASNTTADFFNRIDQKQSLSPIHMKCLSSWACSLARPSHQR